MGLLPITRPTTASYGEDVEDEYPLEAPHLEASADDFNTLRDDAIHVGKVCPLAIVSVANNGTTATVSAAAGILTSQVAVVRTGAGVVTLNFASASITLVYGHANPNHATVRAASLQVTGAQTATVRTFDGAGAADAAFFAFVY